MQPTLTRITASEYLAIAHDYPYIRELLDGEIVLSGSPIPQHNRLIGRAFTQLQLIIPDGELVFAPMDLHLTDRDVPQPDLFWVRAGGQCLQGVNGYYGPPALIVEVLSPSTAHRDRTYKFHLYEKTGVQEYWLVNPLQTSVEVWSLVEGVYVRVGIFGATDTLHHSVIGTSVTFSPLFV